MNKYYIRKYIEKVVYKVTLPTLALTRKSPYKWVRVIGALGIIPLLPLALVGFIIMMLWEFFTIALDIWEMI